MELPSDSDESDVDYVPDENEPHSDKESGTKKKNGRKRPSDGGDVSMTRSKSARSKEDAENGHEAERELSHPVDKKQEDDLWATFLNTPSETKPPKDEPITSDAKVDSGETNTEAVNVVVSRNERRAVLGNKPIKAGGGGAGLSSVLNKIGKSNKLSTLEKSKLDWNNFKKNEGIEEELAVHNRGRDGYLERQDFLERTDHRQFEIEKNIRTITRRSNR